MKNKSSIFAANTPSSLYRLEIAVAIFMSDLLLSAKIRGYRFYNGLLHSCCNLDLAVRRAIAFLILITLFFVNMPSPTKNTAGVNNSNSSCAPTERNTVSTATIQLPCSNPYSIPTFDDFFNEAKRRFNVEMNAKNKAYAFILSMGLLKEFGEFDKAMRDLPDGVTPHDLCLALLLEQSEIK